MALLAGVAPRKRGSFEDWMLRLCDVSHERGHEIEVFVHDPVHPEIEAELDERGVEYGLMSDLLASPLASTLSLSRGFDLIYLRLFAPRDPAALLAYASLPTTVVFADHFSGPPDSRADPGPDSPLLRDRLTAMRWGGLVAGSEYVIERDIARFGLDESKGRVIHNGVDLGRFRPADGSRGTGSTVDVLAVAHLIGEKGIDHLIHALARLDDEPVSLTVAGDGPREEELRALAADLGLADRVDFLGLRDDVDRLMREADIFVHPAVWEDAFPWTVIEAMASGCPVVASRVGGIPEQIVHEESGLLVPPGDEAELARSLRRLTNDEELRLQLGRAARERVEKEFSLDECISDTLDWCETVLER